jgi:hypothetical protein
MVLDGRYLAPTWLAVAAAAGTDKNDLLTHRSMQVALYRSGARLTAWNRYMLLTGWAPARGYETTDDEAGFYDEATETFIIHDVDGRAAGLMRYARSLVPADADDSEVLEVEIGAGEAEERPPGALRLEGMEGEAFQLDVPGLERVRVPVFEGGWPDWPAVLAAFVPKRTMAFALPIERVVQLARLKDLDAPLVVEFGGRDKMARVSIGDPPLNVQGVVMPTMWRWGMPDLDDDGGDTP